MIDFSAGSGRKSGAPYQLASEVATAAGEAKFRARAHLEMACRAAGFRRIRRAEFRYDRQHDPLVAA
jgi:hypothetical protein